MRYRLRVSYTTIVYVYRLLRPLRLDFIWVRSYLEVAVKKYRGPAKIKYDKNHPIVSFRCTPALKAKLDAIKKMSDKTPADILKEAVELQAASAKNSYNKGFLMAKLYFVVTYHCSKCGNVIEISSEGEKKAAAQYMQDNEWGHGECSEK
jgi:hypothetical protein